MTQARSAKASLSHEERTATEPRDKALHPVIIDQVTPVNSRINLYKLAIKDKSGINFLPGQWLDVHVPGIKKAGGFTITSVPRDALPKLGDTTHRPFLELAVQQSPDNPPAAWLWQPTDAILGKELHVRVGGSFVWPPPGVNVEKVKRVVFVAGGVGINPLISILSHIRHKHPSLQVHFLYSTKVPSSRLETSEVLFLPRLVDLIRNDGVNGTETPKNALDIFITGTWDGSELSVNERYPFSPYVQGRIQSKNLRDIIVNEHQRGQSVYYVCGPPGMTDEVVQYLQKQESIAPECVLCEKWW